MAACADAIADVMAGGNGPGSRTGRSYWYTGKGFVNYYDGGANFLLVDGGVQFLTQAIDPEILRELATRAGREVVKVPNASRRLPRRTGGFTGVEE